MPEEEWPQPKFRSSIGKSVPSRVPRFGTWQHDDYDSVASVQLQAQADVQRLSKANSTAGRFHSLSKRCPSSSQSSSEDLSASAAGSAGCVPQTRKRFTKEFEKARHHKVGRENPLDEEDEVNADGRRCEVATQGHGGMDKAADYLRRDQSTQGTAASDSSTAIFRCPSEPPAHWKAPTKKETGGGLLSLGGIRNLGMVIKEAGRTGSGLLRTKSPGRDALAGFLAAQEEAEKKLERTYSQFSEDLRTEECDTAAPKPALLFAGWDNDAHEGLQLSPMSSYSSLFEEMREGRGKRAEKQLERLKLMYASVKEEEEPPPPPPPLLSELQARERDPPPESLSRLLQARERGEVSSPDGGPCCADTNSSSSGTDSAKWDGSPKSDEQQIGGQPELSEAAWLEQRMSKKMADTMVALDPARKKTVNRERDPLQEARGKLSGRMERTYSESVVHSKPRKGRARGADTASRSTPLSTRHQVMSAFPKSTSMSPASAAAQAASSSQAKADSRSSSSDKSQSHRSKDATPRSKSMNARGKRQKNVDSEQTKLHNSPATRDARIALERKASGSQSQSSSRSDAASHASDGRPPRAPQPRVAPVGVAMSEEGAKGAKLRPAPMGGAMPQGGKGGKPRPLPVGTIPEEDLDSSLDAPVRCIRGKLKRYCSAPDSGAWDVKGPPQAGGGWHRHVHGFALSQGSQGMGSPGLAFHGPQQRLASSSSFRAWFRFDRDTKPATA